MPPRCNLSLNLSPRALEGKQVDVVLAEQLLRTYFPQIVMAHPMYRGRADGAQRIYENLEWAGGIEKSIDFSFKFNFSEVGTSSPWGGEH